MRVTSERMRSKPTANSTHTEPMRLGFDLRAHWLTGLSQSFEGDGFVVVGVGS